ncbi:alpha/beta hydrolase [Solimicrobium silvestre]|uniref:Putative hydrolase of the alpha/beta superfamily n=1 Tax=Solimicrobium silvestre TaxID=2099400 RepID=A0A2S9GST8_9BURK|nr:alpha/beta hydrolase-fold protein [Solimicrobium silvestre]PRC90758.1 putative hydrolase of the alpha/beta superfamily [Solimicrobium silvestre]
MVIRSKLMSWFFFLMVPMTAMAADNIQPLVIGETFTVTSKILGEVRRINVYAPPGYYESTNESTQEKVPVLYMPDGGMAEDFLHVAGLVQVSVGNGTMRPYLLVGIENTQRRRDMTGPTENANDKKIAPQVGGSAAFRKFIRDELMPAINSRYRTTHESAIVGESLAGLFVMETLLLEPDLFDTYIAIDPTLGWNNENLSKIAGSILNTQSGMKKHLYLTSSGDGNPEVSQRFAEVLAKDAPAGLRWHYEKMPEEKHLTIYEPAALKAFRAELGPVPTSLPH